MYIILKCKSIYFEKYFYGSPLDKDELPLDRGDIPPDGGDFLLEADVLPDFIWLSEELQI